MTTYVYLYENSLKDTRGVHEILESYVDTRGLGFVQFVEQQKSPKVTWRSREIGHLLIGNLAKPGDVIVVYEAGDLARSTCHLLEILIQSMQCLVDIHFVKYEEVFHAREQSKLSDLLRVMQQIESDFLSQRTTELLVSARHAKPGAGRPKGSKNRALKLDRHREDIVNYLEIGVSRASIAKLVHCHPKTLYDWLSCRNIQQSNNFSHQAQHEIASEPDE